MRVAEVHLLDVGTESYGDCLLLRFDTDGRQTWVLIDGGHRSDKMRLVDQFTDIMRRKPPFRVDLLLISHAHDDHIGALPDLVRDGYVLANYALIPDSGMAFGPPFDKEAAPDAVSRAIALLREEPLEDVESTEELDALAIDAASLRTRYDEMRRHLTNAGTDVVLFGSGSTVGLARLRRAFTHIGLKILGPSPTALDRAAELLRSGGQNVIDAAKALRLTAQDSGVIVNALDAQQYVSRSA
ncbi:MBL fold metallo-hydrolase [Mycobacterium sp. E2733]|uniref:MBL fold metallo-hydrolase n=1 Tax=Mycobacterium sp. E2733 TaxID=1834138 RepID=UPI000801F5E3|nr:MBL fold metallo-hydrolase [Mycobacterium sp. E2733]OBH93757.1 hypothetical protein A5678_05210 [Mycobacterium sp. E2733]